MHHRRRTVAWLSGLLVGPLLAAALLAQEVPGATEYEVKAQFLERFTRFIAWPEPALAAEGEEPFVLGVVGRDPFGDELRQLAGRRVAGRHPVEVLRVRQGAEIERCHLLFVSGSESGRLDEVLAATRGRAILTVGDTAGYARRGVIINLFVDGGKVGFEVNERAARESGLELSSRLLKLARPLRKER